LLVALLLAGPAVAGGDKNGVPAPAKDDGPPSWLEGPTKLVLGHALTLELPKGFIALAREPAKKLMERNGNFFNDNLLGVVSAPDAEWFVTVRYIDDGYVRDDEAEKLDPDAILDALKEGAQESNKIRKEKGFDPFTVEGWTDLPRYEKPTHHITWGTKLSSVHGTSNNFTTRVLGRYGLVSMTLVGGADAVSANKPQLTTLIGATRWDPGAGYEDFQEGKDRVAEYGLAALVAGGAGAAALKLVKVGLLAKFGAKILALLIAGKKLIIVAVVGLLALLRRLFGKKPAADVPTEPPAP
jgi:uncharacterized membrane-anchored protein